MDTTVCRWLTFLVVAFAVALSPGTAASAADVSTSNGFGGVEDAYAREYGVSLAVATTRLQRIQPMQHELLAIREAEHERIAGWGIDHGDEMTGWVLLTGNEPAGTEATHVVDNATDLELLYGADHTLDHLKAESDRMFASDLLPTNIRSAITYTDLDFHANVLVVGLAALEDNRMGSRPHPARVIPPLPQDVIALLRGNTDTSLRIEAAARLQSDNIIIGGAAMGSCTSGFSAVQSGVHGMLTAGHCPDGQLPIDSVSLHYASGFNSANADAQFHIVPTGQAHVLRDDYVCNTPPHNQCDVSGDIARSSMAGDFVCHTGRKSGISCGTVSSTTFRPYWTNACLSGPSGTPGTSSVVCNQVFVSVTGTYLRACNGDSGGPWYRHGVAYGLHKASNGDTDCTGIGKWAVFSGIRETETFLSLQILTGGSVTVT